MRQTEDLRALLLVQPRGPAGRVLPVEVPERIPRQRIGRALERVEAPGPALAGPAAERRGAPEDPAAPPLRHVQRGVHAAQGLVVAVVPRVAAPVRQVERQAELRHAVKGRAWDGNGAATAPQRTVTGPGGSSRGKKDLCKANWKERLWGRSLLHGHGTFSTSKNWRLAVGGWRLAVGGWRLAVGTGL